MRLAEGEAFISSRLDVSLPASRARKVGYELGCDGSFENLGARTGKG